MICSNCSAENKPNAKKCEWCGTKFAPGRSISGFLIATISILSVTVLIVVSYFIFGGADNGSGSHNQVSEPGEGLFAATGEGSDIHGAIHRITYGDNVVYLFGTMHAAAPEWFPLADVVEDAMTRADVFAFEIDMTFASIEMEELMALMLLLETGMYMEQETLADVIPAHIYEELVRYIETYDMTYEEVYRMNPVALITTLQVAVAAEVFAEHGIYYDDQMGVDGYILDFARRNNRPVIGLEPISQQMRIGFAPDQEILDRAGFIGTLQEIYYDALDEFTSRDELFTYLYENTASHYEYLYNDIDALVAGMVVTSEEMENAFTRYMVEVLMNFRSTYYANRIAELLRDTEEATTFFVAVGLSHVVREGEYLTNIVEQLELLGIVADPIWREQ